MFNSKIRILFAVPILFILAACGGNGQDSLLNDTEIEEGYYINYNGGGSENEEMRTSDFIEYDAESDYSLTRPAYVSYYNEDEFIQTNLYVDNMPVLIESVSEATHVRVSFNQNNEDNMVFIDEALEGAESGQESVSEESSEEESTAQDDESGSESDEGEESSANTSSEAFDFESVEGETVLDTTEFTDQDLFMYQGINDEGAFTEMNDLATTRGIAYDSNSEYAINQSADIAYYNESEFLEKNSVDDEGYIENVPDANYINITYNLDNMNDLVLIEED